MKQRTKSKKFIFLFVFIAITLPLCIVALAKYYATTNNSGVAVASGLYFSSNVLSNINGSVSIASAKSESNLPVYLNPKPWTSASYTYGLEIRNHDSILLYNDDNLNISYKIDFVLLEDVAGTSYTVQFGDDVKPITTDTVVSFTSTIQGGKPSCDRFKVTIERANDSSFKGRSGRILAVAYPTAPSYISTSANELRLISIIQGDYSNPIIDIDSKGFKCETGMTSLNWKSILDNLLGYEYNITTTGDIAGSSAAKSDQLVKVTWDNTILDIDRFNSYYLEAISGAANKSAEIETNGTKTTLSIEAMPYANISIVFYRVKDIKLSSDPAISSMDDFKNLVETTITGTT